MPTTTLSGPRLAVAVDASLSGGTAPALISGTISHHPSVQAPTVGSSAGNVNKIYSAGFTVDTGTPFTVDLTSTTDPLGGTVNMAKVVGILIENLSVTTGQDMTVGGGTNGLFAALAPVARANGGIIFIQDINPGITVDSTHKIVSISVAAGTGVAGNLTVIGHS